MNNTAPLLPDDGTPELSVMEPDTPHDTTFADATTIEPDPALVLAPLHNRTDPPVTAAVVVMPPADTKISPPAALEPDPTSTLMEPPRPPVAVPDCNDNQPLLPALVVPLLNNTDPDAPHDTAHIVDTVIEPDAELILVPEPI